MHDVAKYDKATEKRAGDGDVEQNCTPECTGFDSHDLESWRKSRKIAQSKLKDALRAHFSSEEDISSRDKSLLIIMDDNFHLRSMRRDIYRTCQEFLTEFSTSTIGFVTLYVSTPLEVCIKQNNKREGKQRVPEVVVRRMADVIEPPDPSKPYALFERFHATIHNSSNNVDSHLHMGTRASMMTQIGQCLQEALSSPVLPKNELSAQEIARLETERALQREATLRCQLQRLDQMLRKLVGGVGRVDQSKSKSANEARKKILDSFKSNCLEGADDESVVNVFTSLVLGNVNDLDCPLVHSIRQTFNDFIIE
jgi:tRNA uridine 5-carbamoylmethylation protein Kti12